MCVMVSYKKSWIISLLRVLPFSYHSRSSAGLQPGAGSAPHRRAWRRLARRGRWWAERQCSRGEGGVQGHQTKQKCLDTVPCPGLTFFEKYKSFRHTVWAKILKNDFGRSSVGTFFMQPNENRGGLDFFIALLLHGYPPFCWLNHIPRHSCFFL